MSLAGKSREAAVREVNELMAEMNWLKLSAEETSGTEERAYYPAPSVKISVSRDYLAAARKYFDEQGWEYELSADEISDRKFNERMDDIESIELIRGSFPGTGGKLKISFDGDRIIAESISGQGGCGMAQVPPSFSDMTREEFLDELSYVHMGEWKSMYDDPETYDGEQWSVDIAYKNGDKRNFGGCNRFPYNFEDLLDVMRAEGD